MPGGRITDARRPGGAKIVTVLKNLCPNLTRNFVFPGRFRVLGIEPEFLFSTSARVGRLFFCLLNCFTYCVASALSTDVIAEV
jgi:hypothetical protein